MLRVEIRKSTNDTKIQQIRNKRLLEKNKNTATSISELIPLDILRDLNVLNIYIYIIINFCLQLKFLKET